MDQPTTSPHDSTRAIIRHVAEQCGVTVREIISGHSREFDIVDARHAAIRAVHRLKPHLSTPMIGRIFGLDHTSVLHALGGTRQEAVASDSWWLRNAISSAVLRDPVDALQDAEQLLAILTDWVRGLNLVDPAPEDPPQQIAAE